MIQTDSSQKIYYTLRIAIAMCFIGHGAFGIITKPIWCNYFGVVGINHDLAYQLMPWVGSFDILMGILILAYPMRVVPLWLVLWGLLTASMRPLSGEPFAEFIERAGNYGVPLALLLLTGGIKNNIKNIFSPIPSRIEADQKAMKRVKNCLRVIVFLLLAGHGWLNLIEKKAILNQYHSLGFSNPAKTALLVGIFEITTAFAILIKPVRPVLFILFIWKTASELFYPQYGIFEWIERGGSYGALLALWFATEKTPYRHKLENIFSKLKLVQWSKQ
ncbi:MAG: hypothetical protein JST75_00795 [Bacteroidetes bacterium]|nr:hypothetical protein [Bacteroidota bacterium]